MDGFLATMGLGLFILLGGDVDDVTESFLSDDSFSSAIVRNLRLPRNVPFLKNKDSSAVSSVVSFLMFEEDEEKLPLLADVKSKSLELIFLRYKDGVRDFSSLCFVSFSLARFSHFICLLLIKLPCPSELVDSLRCCLIPGVVMLFCETSLPVVVATLTRLDLPGVFIAPYLFKTLLLLSVMSLPTDGEVLLLVDTSFGAVVVGVVRVFVVDVVKDVAYFDGDASLVEDGKVDVDVFATCEESIFVVDAIVDFGMKGDLVVGIAAVGVGGVVVIEGDFVAVADLAVDVAADGLKDEVAVVVVDDVVFVVDTLTPAIEDVEPVELDADELERDRLDARISAIDPLFERDDMLELLRLTRGELITELSRDESLLKAPSSKASPARASFNVNC